MSKSEILYVKGMNISESEDGEEDIWDDSKLKEAYDRALKIANEEVARRVASSTNNQDGKYDKAKKNKSSKPNPCKNPQKWKAGMPCRAVYDVDGLEYEAFVLRIINDKECVVRFLGYENTDIVPLSALKPTLGQDERKMQIEQALNDKTDDNLLSHSPDVDRMEIGNDQMQGPGSAATFIERTSQSNKKSSKKKKNRHQNQPPMTGFQMPFPMPNLVLPENVGSFEMPPLPPPPPHMFLASNRAETEDQTISSMLLSWYMSGYYAGLYQGIRRSRESRKN